MQHWIVTHNPHPIPDSHGWNIFFRKLPKRMPAVGERVLFYETEALFEGRDRPGEKAVVRAGRVTGGPGPVSGIDPWVYQMPCETIRDGFVPLAQVRQIIKQPFFRRNLTPISETQYRTIEQKMLENGAAR
jgi:hypothetical protein